MESGSVGGWTRRNVLGAGLASLTVAALAARAGLDEEAGPLAGRGRISADRRAWERGRLMGHPSKVERMAPLGLRPLGLEPDGRDGRLFVPAGYRPERPSPMVLMLHGAGGNSRDAMAPLQGLADEIRFHRWRLKRSDQRVQDVCIATAH